MASVHDSSSRRRRVTYVQLETLWEFLNSHKEVAIGYNKSAQAREYSKRMWESVTEALNSQGEGAIKDCKGWSSYWIDYKAKLKKRAAAVRSALNRTGGGPTDIPPLNEIEKKNLSLLGSGYGTGMPNTQVPIPFLALSQTSSTGELGVLEAGITIPSSSEPVDPHLPEQPPVEDEVPQSHAPPETPQHSQSQNSSSNIREATTSRPVRQRRRREGHISQEAARRTLIQISKSRLDLETKNSQTLLKMLDALNKIAEKIDDRAVGGPEARDEGAPDS